MNNIPLVSVAIVTYNQERTISQTLECALNQIVDFPFEIVVGEDCSTDATREICKQYESAYPDSIRLILHEKNRGLLRNYKSVLDACRGKYIAHCAGDDYWHNPKKLQLQVDVLEKDDRIGLVHSDVDLYDIDRNKCIPYINRHRNLHILNGNFTEYVFFNMLPVYTPTYCVRRDLICQVDFDVFIDQGFIMEDLPLYIELSRLTDFYYVDESLATYRYRRGSMCRPLDMEKKIRYYESTYAVRKYYQKKYFSDTITDERIEQAHDKSMFSIYLEFNRLRKAYDYFCKINGSPSGNKLRYLVSRSYPLFVLVAKIRKLFN